MGHQFLDTPGFRIDLGFVGATSSKLILEHEVSKLLHLQSGKTWGYVLIGIYWFSQRIHRQFLTSSLHPTPTACSMIIFIGQDLGAPHASKSKICVQISATCHRTSAFILFNRIQSIPRWRKAGEEIVVIGKSWNLGKQNLTIT